MIVIVNVNASPIQADVVATGEMVYTTSTGAEVIFVQASLATTFCAKPLPVTGVPADAVKPLASIVVML